MDRLNKKYTEIKKIIQMKGSNAIKKVKKNKIESSDKKKKLDEKKLDSSEPSTSFQATCHQKISQLKPSGNKTAESNMPSKKTTAYSVLEMLNYSSESGTDTTSISGASD